MILTVGTGGTLTGISRKLREKIPNCKIIAVDPYGSILAHENMIDHEKEIDESKMTGYDVEGIG